MLKLFTKQTNYKDFFHYLLYQDRSFEKPICFFEHSISVEKSLRGKIFDLLFQS